MSMSTFATIADYYLAIIGRCHNALGESEHSDHDSLPEAIATHIRERDQRIAELERKYAAECEASMMAGSQNSALRLQLRDTQPEDTFRKDAERYRFLRNTPPWKSPVTVVKTRTVGDDIAMLTHEALDATIDECLPQLHSHQSTKEK